MKRSKFNIYIEDHEWAKVTISEGKRRSLKGHIPVINKKLEQEECKCVLIFKQNRVKKENSRKRSTPFFVGTAVCKHKDCLKYSFKINKTPRSGKRVKVRVKISGRFNHSVSKKERRNIVKEERERMQEALLKKGADETYYENLSSAKIENLKNANYNHVPNKMALRKMLQEVISKEFMDRDIFREIEIVSDVLDEHFAGGYVRFYSKQPFGVLLFSDTQIKIAMDAIKEGKGAMYLDATGSVVNKVPEQPHKVFYYSLVIRGNDGDPPLPVADFITNRHTVPDITNFLTRIKYKMEQMRRSKNLPSRIEVDHSWAMIHSVQLAFNQMPTKSYIDHAWNGIDPPCKVHICSSHVLNHVSKYIRREKKEVRHCIMTFVGAMIQASSLDSLTKIFSLLCRLTLDTEDSSPEDKEMYKKLHSGDMHELYNEEADETDERLFNDEDPVQSKDGSWVVNTPYYIHFFKIYQEHSGSDESSETATRNKLYAPAIVKYLLRRLMSICPLWTGILFNGEHFTNAIAEVWFKIVKNSVLKGDTKLRPAVFIRKLAYSIVGRTKEYELRTYKGKLLFSVYFHVAL